MAQTGGPKGNPRPTRDWPSSTRRTGPDRLKVHVVACHAFFIRTAVSNPLPERPGGPAVPSILVIEDDEAVRGLFRAILEPVGYLIEEASTGWEGIRRFRESPTD